MLKKYFLLLCVVSVFASSSFAFEMGSISRIDNEKAYLKPGLLQVAKNGIFVNVGDQLIAIDHLKSDEEGVYFDLGYNAGGSTCPLCNFPLIFGLFCFNPNCPSKN